MLHTSLKGHVSVLVPSAPLLRAGVKYPLRWIQQIKAKSTDKAQWRVMVDAAAYVPTQPLDLRKVNPDFVSLSFYKMFGYPTVRQYVTGTALFHLQRESAHMCALSWSVTAQHVAYIVLIEVPHSKQVTE
jgi:hypothetical protein